MLTDLFFTLSGMTFAIAYRKRIVEEVRVNFSGSSQ